MFNGFKTHIIALLALACLFGLTACGSVQTPSAPNMVDYSYVPQQAAQLSVLSAPGIESY